MKLTQSQKDQIIDAISKHCQGTPLQPNAEFASHYLGNYVISLLENRDELLS